LISGLNSGESRGAVAEESAGCEGRLRVLRCIATYRVSLRSRSPDGVSQQGRKRVKQRGRRVGRAAKESCGNQKELLRSMARKKLKVIHVPGKPEDEKFKSLDR